MQMNYAGLHYLGYFTSKQVYATQGLLILSAFSLQGAYERHSSRSWVESFLVDCRTKGQQEWLIALPDLKGL